MHTPVKIGELWISYGSRCLFRVINVLKIEGQKTVHGKSMVLDLEVVNGKDRIQKMPMYLRRRIGNGWLTVTQKETLGETTYRVHGWLL